jgi:hypothetical protein
MAICLPGMASRVNRAATSATRPAPLVMTTNWMTMRITKMISPTTIDPPTTKWPNDSMTWPANPCSSTSRVALTLSASRNIVAMSSREGKIEKSSGRVTYMLTSRISTAPVMLTAMSRSRSTVGSGTMSMTTMNTIAAGTPIWPRRVDFTQDPMREEWTVLGRGWCVAVLAPPSSTAPAGT